VIWTGFPGIGKSTDINYILMELLLHMGEESWPAMVAFRVNDYLFEFTSTDVRCVPITFDGLIRYAKKHGRDNSVLILELIGDETTPLMKMPFIIAESSRRLKNKFKDHILADSAKIMLVTPPDVEEVCLMSEAIVEVCPNNTIFEGKTKAEAISLVRKRAWKIGAIPRYLFGSKGLHSLRLKDMIAKASSKLSFDTDALNVDDISPGAQYFVAPYFKFGVTDPSYHYSYEEAAPELFASLSDDDEMHSSAESSSYEFRYLSDYAKLLHATKLKDVQVIESLKSMGVAYQVSEAIIRHGGILPVRSFEKLNENYLSDSWEWHKDVGAETTLSRDSLLPAQQIPTLPRCSDEIIFGGTYYEGSVSQLKEDRLYRGHYVNLCLYKYFTVDHKKKVLNLYHVTSVDLKDHSFPMSAIESIMSKLRMFEKNNLEYNIVLLCFCDWSRTVTHGIKFDAGSLKTLRSQGDPIATRLQTYVIRACLLPLSTKYELGPSK